MDEKIIEAEFIIIENRGTKNTLECPRCGCTFDIDAHKETNMVFCPNKVSWLAQCPLCNTRQI